MRLQGALVEWIVPTYSAAFKSKMVQRMLGPQGRSALSLSGETGVSQSSLSKWLRQAEVRTMTERPKPPKNEKRPEDWTASEKLAAVMEANGLTDAELGEFLRRKGVHEAQLMQWRRAMLEALGTEKTSRASPETRRVRELEKQLLRKDKALAEAAALLVLQKKVRAIWGGGDDDTEPESDE
jgi:transposase